MKIIRGSDHGPVGMFPPQSVLYIRRDGKTIDGHLSAAMIYDDEGNEEETKKKYKTLMTFLKSPTTRELIDESEKLLSEGKKVNVKLYITNGNPRYELEIID